MIGATMAKEIQLLLRDRGGLLAMFLLPAIFITTFGFMFMGAGGDGNGQNVDENRPIPRIGLAVWHEDDHDEAEAIVRSIESTGSFAVSRIADAETLRANVAKGQFRAGLLIPPDYHAQDHQAELCMDLAVRDIERIAVEGPLRGAFSRHEGFKLSPLRPEDLPPSPPFFQAKSPPGIRRAVDNLDSFQISVPGNSVLFVFFLSMGVALSFYEERKSGTWKRLLAAPGGRLRKLFAKLLPFVVIGCAQMTVLLLLGRYAFGMRIGGSLLALCVITVCVVLCATTLGLLIASFGGTEKQISSYSSIAVLAMALLGGCMFPRMFMPETFKAVGNFVPHGWALDAYYDVLIRDGTSLPDVALPCAVLLGFALAFGGLGALLFRFEK